MNGRWTFGYVLTSAMLLAGLAQLPAPRWWRRWQLRRELRDVARYRRRIRQTVERAEADLRAHRAGHPSADGLNRDQLGRELAACAVLLVDTDQRIDHALDQLDALK